MPHQGHTFTWRSSLRNLASLERELQHKTSAYGAKENDSSPHGHATAKMRCVRLQKPSDFRNT